VSSVGGRRYERQQQGWQRQTRALQLRCEVLDLRLTDMGCEVRGVDGDRAAAADQGLLVTAAAAASEAAAAKAAAAAAAPLLVYTCAHTHTT
jgi:hypothetical protein